jgi:hypothetical protein
MFERKRKEERELSSEFPFMFLMTSKCPRHFHQEIFMARSPCSFENVVEGTAIYLTTLGLSFLGVGSEKRMLHASGHPANSLDCEEDEENEESPWERAVVFLVFSSALEVL